ncbi:Iron-sulfur cluster co-chaperone protein HscB [Frankliniella fusca]|uniref:Iron-sulfur cluster co-chaperone protein HscB n=1 Tax=Frankliniella fusca TaxID=407009 RepID=A0AAE1LL35_9NEOP|nr:Iron-sulfur cluster co-chaperone protein HscB [Frankliniella fusca]
MLVLKQQTAVRSVTSESLLLVMSLTSRMLGRANSRSLSAILFVHKSVPLPNIISCTFANKVINSPPFHSQFRALASSDSGPSCWKCGAKERRSFFFCQQCDALQEPGSNYNYFKLLGVNQTFDIDNQELSKKFRHLQSVLHPDKFSNASESEQSYSADLSSLVNKAFRTLLDPLERGLYLLSLAGHEIPEGNTSFNKAFLLEIMELNEELESISSISELKEFQTRNKMTVEIILRKVSDAFGSGDYTSAKAALMEMKYYATLDGKIREKEMSIETL